MRKNKSISYLTTIIQISMCLFCFTLVDCRTILTTMGMEVNVLNELPGGGGILTVSTHPNATVDSLIGAACQVCSKISSLLRQFALRQKEREREWSCKQYK